MAAYYNEIDHLAAEWLRELIKAAQIAPGEVDERDIRDVQPDELSKFTQCHFFAGIGVWSYALRQAGWPDDKPVWTGSCPCQSFSVAGKQKGIQDERHLWPAWYRLIRECRPPVIFGEQVASIHTIGSVAKKQPSISGAGGKDESKDGPPWVNIVQADLERDDYAIGACVAPSCGFGSPHIRQRLWFVAGGLVDTLCCGQQGPREVGQSSNTTAGKDWEKYRVDHAGRGCRLAQPNGGQCDGRAEAAGGDQCDRQNARRAQSDGGASGSDDVERLANTDNDRPQPGRRATATARYGGADHPDGSVAERQPDPGPVNGFWRDADWLFCRDGKWRATQSIDEPMDDGIADRLGYSRIAGRYSLNPLKEKAENGTMRLKGYGNAINTEAAKAFIKSYMEIGNAKNMDA